MRPISLRNAAVALLAVTAATFVVVKNAEAVPFNDSSDSSTAHVESVCFFVQNPWDYNEVKGQVCAYTQNADGGVSVRHNCVSNIMSGANLTAVQTMITSQATPLWVAGQTP